MGDHERLAERQFAIGVISGRREARKIHALRVRAGRQAEGAGSRRSSKAQLDFVAYHWRTLPNVVQYIYVQPKLMQA